VSWRRLGNTYRLGRKELVSLRRDPVLALFVVYAFTYAIYVPAATTGLELRHASVAFADHDHSQLSARLQDSVLPPYFHEPDQISLPEAEAAMDAGAYTFVMTYARLEGDAPAGRALLSRCRRCLAMSQAGIGAGYLERILGDEIRSS
jgi:ABC-2 type transport system permease protein